MWVCWDRRRTDNGYILLGMPKWVSFRMEMSAFFDSTRIMNMQDGIPLMRRIRTPTVALDRIDSSRLARTSLAFPRCSPSLLVACKFDGGLLSIMF